MWDIYMRVVHHSYRCAMRIECVIIYHIIIVNGFLLWYVRACYTCSDVISRSARYSICLLRSLTRFARSLTCPWGLTPRGQMGGVGGRQRSCRLPPQLHSENRFMVEGPLKGPGSTWRMRAREGPQNWMMELPLGFRVSGPFRRKGPIFSQPQLACYQ